VYLRLLQEGTLEASVTRPASDGFSLAVMPSAVEISEQCEIACTEAAEQLSQRVERREQETEKARRGELWLINEELASVIEQQIRDKRGSRRLTKLLSKRQTAFMPLPKREPVKTQIRMDQPNLLSYGCLQRASSSPLLSCSYPKGCS